MVTRLITKYGKLLIDILVIGLIVVAVVWINPFGIFGGNKLKLQSTANNVSSIKKIGQLITAEYYGETIATYKEAKLTLIEEDDISERGNDLFRDMKDYIIIKRIESYKPDEFILNANEVAETPEKEKKGLRRLIGSIFGRKTKKADFKREIKKHISTDKGSSKKPDGSSKNLGTPEFFNDDKETAKEVLAFYFNKNEISDADIPNYLWKLSKEILKKKDQLNNEKAFSEYINQGLDEIKGRTFSDFYYRKKEKGANLGGTKISIIGRGWVKAGFDFGALNDDNFVFDKEHAIVHIYGVHPEILAKDINPWFIPEKKVPGFQILESRKATFDQAKKVKSYCIDKLEKMAIEAGILKQAERQSKEAIKNFIGLVTNTEVKHVHFHTDSLVRFTDDILKDKLISYEEARKLDSLIPAQIKKIITLDTVTKHWISNQKKAEIQKVRLKNAITKLKKTPYLRKKNYYNRFSFIKDSIIRDSLLTNSEKEWIKTKKWEAAQILDPDDNKYLEKKLEHHIWYGDSILDFIGEYNDFILDLKKEDSLITVDKISFFKEEHKKEKKELRKSKTIRDSMSGRDVFTITEQVYKVTDVHNYVRILNLTYPIKLPLEWKKKWFSKYNENLFFPKQLSTSTDQSEVSANQLLTEIEKTRFSKLLNTTAINAKKVDGIWEIALTTNHAIDKQYSDENALIEYLANYYLKRSTEYKWFTIASNKTKQNLKNRGLDKKMKKTKKDITSFFQNLF